MNSSDKRMNSNTDNGWAQNSPSSVDKLSEAEFQYFNDRNIAECLYSITQKFYAVQQILPKATSMRWTFVHILKMN